MDERVGGRSKTVDLLAAIQQAGFQEEIPFVSPPPPQQTGMAEQGLCTQLFGGR
jgi:hypothetical protein